VNDISKTGHKRILIVIEEYAAIRLDKEYGSQIE